MPDPAPTLSTFLDAAAATHVTWMLVGSMATRLHGARIDPGDVDILVHPDTCDAPLWDLATLLTPAGPGPAGIPRSWPTETFKARREADFREISTGPTSPTPSPDTPDAAHDDEDLGSFRSIAAQPLLQAGDWTFGRWFVTGGKLEVARIREDLEAGLLENHGRLTWHHRRTVHWRGRDVPVVPLEVQWATMASRGQHERMRAVMASLPRDWDEELARQALRDRGVDPGGAGTWALP